MFTQRRERAPRITRARQATRKLHMIHGLLRGRVVDGQFEAQGAAYRFNFVPKSISLSERKLILSGRFIVDSPRSGTRAVEDVQAQLAATQGGVGISPVRRQLLTGTAQTGQIATPEQKLEQEKGPETELQPGMHAFEKPKTDKLGRPVTESTGERSFVGMLYLHLRSLSGADLGVPLDLSRVQLNVRLASTDDLARDLQILLTDLVAALYGDQPDERSASEQIKEINRLLAG